MTEEMKSKRDRWLTNALEHLKTVGASYRVESAPLSFANTSLNFLQLDLFFLGPEDGSVWQQRRKENSSPSAKP